MNRSLWKFLTSLRLTVVCLIFGIVLVFVGTVAQADEGLYQAQARYFKQWIVFGPMLWGHRLPVPLPGGYLIGTTLLVNLIAAHINRFQWSARKVGIHLTHFGIIVLLLGQLATDMLSDESHLRLKEGEARSFTEAAREHELVFTTDLDAKSERVVSVPESLVAKKVAFENPELPFEVRVKEYHVNGEVIARQAVVDAAGKLSSALVTVEGQYASNDGLLAQAERAQESEGRAAVWRGALAAIGEDQFGNIVDAARRISADPAKSAKLREELKTRFQSEMISRFTMQNGAMRLAAERMAKKEPITPESFPVVATKGDGPQAVAVARPENKDMDRGNLPWAVIEVLQKGASLGTWLVSPYLLGQEIQIGDKTWRAALRAERNYLPFSVKLLKTTHEVYRGTDIPKNFQSRVRIENPGRSETREADIYMNNPLRYEGLTFFQYQMGKDERDANVGTSTLQVVKNPSWLTPYFGCILVGLGMTWQFLYHLVGFITKRRTA